MSYLKTGDAAVGLIIYEKVHGYAACISERLREMELDSEMGFSNLVAELGGSKWSVGGCRRGN